MDPLAHKGLLGDVVGDYISITSKPFSQQINFLILFSDQLKLPLIAAFSPTPH